MIAAEMEEVVDRLVLPRHYQLTLGNSPVDPAPIRKSPKSLITHEVRAGQLSSTVVTRNMVDNNSLEMQSLQELMTLSTIAFDKCRQLTREMPTSYATRAAGVHLK